MLTKPFYFSSSGLSASFHVTKLPAISNILPSYQKIVDNLQNHVKIELQSLGIYLSLHNTMNICPFSVFKYHLKLGNCHRFLLII